MINEPQFSSKRIDRQTRPSNCLPSGNVLFHPVFDWVLAMRLERNDILRACEKESITLTFRNGIITLWNILFCSPSFFLLFFCFFSCCFSGKSVSIKLYFHRKFPVFFVVVVTEIVFFFSSFFVLRWAIRCSQQPYSSFCGWLGSKRQPTKLLNAVDPTSSNWLFFLLLLC